MSFCPVDKHFRRRIKVGEEELGFLQLFLMDRPGSSLMTSCTLSIISMHGACAASFLYQSCISICEMPLLLE
jgi:hypothetical protein